MSKDNKLAPVNADPVRMETTEFIAERNLPYVDFDPTMNTLQSIANWWKRMRVRSTEAARTKIFAQQPALASHLKFCYTNHRIYFRFKFRCNSRPCDILITNRHPLPAKPRPGPFALIVVDICITRGREPTATKQYSFPETFNVGERIASDILRIAYENYHCIVNHTLSQDPPQPRSNPPVATGGALTRRIRIRRTEEL
jgi:hypothetical protein